MGRKRGPSDIRPTTRQLDRGQLLLAVLLKRGASPFDEGGVVFGQGFDVFYDFRDGISGVDLVRGACGLQFISSAS